LDYFRTFSITYRSRFKRWDVRNAWNYGPNVLTNECDVLIALGMRFDDRVTGNLATYAKQAK
jgi:thiamine pyrophosphate-dependent acetolactate synthase large subunit-like protein